MGLCFFSYVAGAKIRVCKPYGARVNIEDRLVDIEIKVTSQEDLTQELSHLVYQQQKQIDELRALCTALVKKLGNMDSDGDGPDVYAHEKPPHY